MSSRVSIELNPKLAEYVDILLEVGLFGLDRQECAERLICMQITDLMDGDTPIAGRLRAAVMKNVKDEGEEA